MSSFENMQTFSPDKDKKPEFPFSYEFPDGTVGRYETKEEMDKAVTEYKEGL
jgi:hypothetical protein